MYLNIDLFPKTDTCTEHIKDFVLVLRFLIQMQDSLDCTTSAASAIFSFHIGSKLKFLDLFSRETLYISECVCLIGHTTPRARQVGLVA